MRPWRRLRSDAGTTVAEMTVAVSLFGLIMLAVFSALDSGTDAERGQQARADALVELRQAMTKLTRDLRQAVHVDPGSTHERLAITTIVGPDELDVTYQLVQDPPGSDTYDLRRTLEGRPTEALVDNMEINTTDNPDPAFCYSFDSGATPPVCVDGGVVPPALTAIRITLAKDPEHDPGEPVTLATDVELRNL